MRPDDIIAALERLAELLNPSAQAVWRLAYRQTLIDACTSLGSGIVLLCVSVVSLTSLNRWYRRAKAEDEKRHSYDQIDFAFFNLLGLFALSLVGIFALTQAIGGLQKLANPEYVTLLRLAQTVLGK